MPQYRRVKLSGGTFFFTVALTDRRDDLLVRQIERLRRVYHARNQRIIWRVGGGHASLCPPYERSIVAGTSPAMTKRRVTARFPPPYRRYTLLILGPPRGWPVCDPLSSRRAMSSSCSRLR